MKLPRISLTYANFDRLIAESERDAPNLQQRRVPRQPKHFARPRISGGATKFCRCPNDIDPEVSLIKSVERLAPYAKDFFVHALK